MFTRKPVLDDALHRRVVVNTPDGISLMVGRLAKYDDQTYVLEQCETIPAPGETAQPIPGRHYVDRIHGFLTESLT